MPVERRRFPRMRVAFPLEVCDLAGASVPAVAIDISSDGIQFECDILIAKQIVPDVSELVFTQNVELKLKCELPLSDGNVSQVTLPGKVVYVRRASQNAYNIGVVFSEMGDDDYNGLAAFFDER